LNNIINGGPLRRKESRDRSLIALRRLETKRVNRQITDKEKGLGKLGNAEHS
jgi:hypothetical protein